MGYYGLIADREAHVEMLVTAPAPLVLPSLLPAVSDLSAWLPPRMYQAPFGTCAIHSAVAAMRFNWLNSDTPDVALSRLQLYYDVRKLEGNAGLDAGARIRDVVRVANTIGVADESLWPYDPARWNDQPPASVYMNATQHEALNLRAVGTDPIAVRAALWTGRPVLVGIEVFPGFEGDQATETGLVPMPGSNETPMAAHSMLLWGRGQVPGHFSLQNWWQGWGDERGTCYLLEDYLPRYSTDNWVIEMTTGEP